MRASTLVLVAGVLLWVAINPVAASRNLLQAAAGNATAAAPAYTTVLDAAAAANASGAANLSVLIAAVRAANLTRVLSNESTAWTILAPTDAAFAEALEAIQYKADELLNDTQLLKTILYYHVIPVPMLSANLTDGQNLTTLLGENVTVSLEGGNITFISNVSKIEATVLVPDITAGMSVIHVVDAVLIPGVLTVVETEESENSTTADTSANTTMTGPLPGAGARRLQQANATANMTTAAPAAYPTLLDAAVAANRTANLSILIAAVEAANLTEVLEDNSTAWSILAPNNAAFEAALTELDITAADLLNDTALLTALLSYHIIPAPVYSSNLTNNQSVPTLLAGNNVTVSLAGGNVTFVAARSNGTVLVADIPAGMSVIHVIDGVLLPEEIFNDDYADDTEPAADYEMAPEGDSAGSELPGVNAAPAP